MAGRIRTIKPEMLENARIAKLSAEAFRLFIGCLLQADDYGSFYAEPARLQGAIFWGKAPTTPIEDLLVELSRHPREGHAKPPLLFLYTVEGERYAYVTGWFEHQRVDKPGNPRVPSPLDADDKDALNSIDLGRIRDSLARLPRVSRESPAPDLRSPDLRISGSPDPDPRTSDPRARESPPADESTPKRNPSPPTPHEALVAEVTALVATPKRAGTVHDGGMVGALVALAEQAAPALAPPLPADEYARRAVDAYEAIRASCTPGRAPGWTPYAFARHADAVQRIVAGVDPRPPPWQPNGTAAEKAGKAPDLRRGVVPIRKRGET